MIRSPIASNEIGNGLARYPGGRVANLAGPARSLLLRQADAWQPEEGRGARSEENSAVERVAVIILAHHRLPHVAALIHRFSLNALSKTRDDVTPLEQRQLERDIRYYSEQITFLYRAELALFVRLLVPRDLLLIWPQMRVGLHTTSVSKEREPVPDQGDRNTNVVEGVDTGYGL
jgi:hypothetical protein